ncbi:MAG: putative toxin-antitoxin system toxin component, PIN family [Elusimicrobiota bacterium]
MRVVLDTNVVVSGFLNPSGPPGTLVRMVAEGILCLCHDARILAEYRDVLLRPKFGLPASLVEPFLEQIEADGFLASAAPLPSSLPDPDDEPFLEIAVASLAPLVTGNIRHYPAKARVGAEVLAPAAFVARLRGAKRPGT